ncbi:ABC transporter ATP-binding protein [Polymorphospora rubra]|uniref:ABC transporter permease n=1 Tax=Polymorphospora rubra TaxID=338584 RepID=A0A810N8V7_9ACTN|nr:ABC transporter ATP-binding protein [Polymorphospora rubra]BCJ68228.1 ABC transporter permease [Polymorphospora rubra]
MRDLFATARRLLSICWHQNRRKTIVAVTLMIAGAVAAPLTALGLRWLIDAALEGRTTGAVLAGVTVAVLAVAALTLGHFAHIAHFELSELNVVHVDREIIRLANGSPGLAHHERADYADRLTVLRREMQQLRSSLEALLALAGLAVAMLLTAVLLAMVNPFLLLLPLAAVPPLITGRFAERMVDRAKIETAQADRVAQRLFQITTDAGPAKELRVFRLQREVLARHRALWDGVTRRLWRSHQAATLVRTVGQLCFAAGYVVCILLVVRDAAAGRRTVGEVVLSIALAAQVNQQVAAAVAQLQQFQQITNAFVRLDEVRALIDAAEPGTAPDAEPPGRLRQGIRLRGVEFGYPGAAAPVLRDVDVTLPAGTSVAIVGENGAGKSTLVKLLCGFYQPVQGEILVDGVELRRIPLDRWRSRIAAGFQDFVRFELLAREAVGVGDLPRITSGPAVSAALERAQATEVVDRLEHGLETPLGKTLPQGTELSGGQWQKLALGRALMREEPLLLVLDEPTSALDAAAEHALFERYAAQSRELADKTGAITVFVSHRFSTVRMADLIIVVADGRIVESGDHTTLVRAGGLYAELYELQAEAYR